MIGPLAFKLVWSGFSMIFVLVGLFIANKGRKLRGRGKMIEETETTKIRQLKPGKAEVKGTARATEGSSTLESPIHHKEALATRVMVEEYRSNSDGGGSWESIYDETESVPFVVDDGTGEVRVEPPLSSGTNLNPELERERVGGGEEPSEKVKRFIEREEGVGSASKGSIGPLDFGERRRYSEGVIEPGENVYVLGRARKDEAGWGERGYVIDETTASGEFVLSDKSEEQLVKEGKWGGILLLVFGVVFALFGTGFVVFPWLFGGL